MKDFYTAFYAATEHSLAHHIFCLRVFGIDLCQHGFASLEQLELLLQVTGLGPDQHTLDLGCGNGMIAEYLSDRSGAHFTGIDYIPLAIEQAQKRTIKKSDRLSFTVGDINALDLPDNTYNVIISIDSIYFSQNYSDTLKKLKAALRQDGQMAFLYSQGREPWVPVEDFDKESILPDQTPLAKVLQANGLVYRTWDLTSQDYALAQQRKEILMELKPQFEAEGNLFIYENRMGDAQGVSQAIEVGLHRRYLYIVKSGNSLFPNG
jgi:cyclopropane fatty-acyl-phospholipid synthase-like methyltransferase